MAEASRSRSAARLLLVVLFLGAAVVLALDGDVLLPVFSVLGAVAAGVALVKRRGPGG